MAENEGNAMRATCYVCAEPIAPEDGDREHVIPRGLFNPADRQNLLTLPAHRQCNQSFSQDDERFRLYVTAESAPHNDRAAKLWSGPVLRGMQRPQATGFRRSILGHIVPVELSSPEGEPVGMAAAMLQEPESIHRVVNRITRGLYTHCTGRILPADWPVMSDRMPSDPKTLRFWAEGLQIRPVSIGRGTFFYAWKHLEEDDREGLFWLVFYDTVHYWGYTGEKIRSRFPWSNQLYAAQTAL